MNDIENNKEEDILIFDTSSRRNGTITKTAWNVFENKNNQQ